MDVWQEWGPGDTEDIAQFYVTRVAGRGSVLAACQRYVDRRCATDPDYDQRLARLAGDAVTTFANARAVIAMRLAGHILDTGIDGAYRRREG